MPPKIISLNGEVGWEIEAELVRKALIAANNQPVRIDLDSPGGFVYEGVKIFNLIRDYEGDIEIRLMSLAASMGSYIALAGNKVTAFDNVTFFIHNALTFSYGNHHDLRKTAGRLEGVSNLLANTYANKTGKSLEEIHQLMDDETFLFGKEILEAGFVDEIIESNPKSKYDKKDKDSAITEARLSIDNCFAKMRESEEAKADLNQMAAYLDVKANNDIPLEPASGHSGRLNNIDNNSTVFNTEEVTNMTLTEFLATNPGGKIEFDQAIKQAEEKGADEGKKAIQAKLNKIAPIVASVVYPEAIKKLASEVIAGEEEYGTLKGAVTMFDAQAEADKSKQAQIEAGEETPPGQPVKVKEDGNIENEADYQAEIARMKQEVS